MGDQNYRFSKKSHILYQGAPIKIDLDINQYSIGRINSAAKYLPARVEVSSDKEPDITVYISFGAKPTAEKFDLKFSQKSFKIPQTYQSRIKNDFSMRFMVVSHCRCIGELKIEFLGAKKINLSETQNTYRLVREIDVHDIEELQRSMSLHNRGLPSINDDPSSYVHVNKKVVSRYKKQFWAHLYSKNAKVYRRNVIRSNHKKRQLEERNHMSLVEEIKMKELGRIKVKNIFL